MYTSRFTKSAAAFAAAGAMLLLPAAASHAAATKSTPILLVHGFDPLGIDCKDATMSAWVNGLRARGFTRLHTVGWYRGDRNCNLSVPGIGNNTANTSLNQIGPELNHLIADHFGTTKVAVVGHSMGGLVVRRALAGAHEHEGGLNHDIRVSDVVAAGTPHRGTLLGDVCAGLGGLTQCQQVRANPLSPFLATLRDNPQTAGSTDWTLTGSGCDMVVSAASATAMGQGSPSFPSVRRITFPGTPLCYGGISHNALVTSAKGLNAIANGILTDQ